MTKLCARGKAAAKRKFKVYPSAYANAYASKICAGKAKDPSGVKRKDWGPKKANEGVYVKKPVMSANAKIKTLKPNPAKLKYNREMQEYYKATDTKPRPRRTKKMNTGGDAKIKKVIKGLKKASKLHAAQAKTLKTVKVRGGGMAIQGMNFKGVY